MEGSLVRLDAACRDSGTPRVCGNLVLFKQMEAASNLIERDVIFASRSLYVFGERVSVCVFGNDEGKG